MAVPTLLPAGVPPVPRVLNPAELRARARLIPLIEYGAAGTYVVICPQEGELALPPDSPEWFGWFATLSSFRGCRDNLAALQLTARLTMANRHEAGWPIVAATIATSSTGWR